MSLYDWRLLLYAGATAFLGGFGIMMLICVEFVV